MDELQVQLSSGIDSMLKMHNWSIYLINEMLMDIGFDYYGIDQERDDLLRITNMDLKIIHENDYIEMGPAIPDPKEEHFYVYSTYELHARFDVAKYMRVYDALYKFYHRHDGEDVVNVFNTSIDHVRLDWRCLHYPKIDKRSHVMASNEWFFFKLKFEIYHLNDAHVKLAQCIDDTEGSKHLTKGIYYEEKALPEGITFPEPVISVVLGKNRSGQFPARIFKRVEL